MDINLFNTNSPKSRFDTLCEDQVYLERNINLVQETLYTLQEEHKAFNKQLECNDLRISLIKTNIEIEKTDKLISIKKIKEYNKALKDLDQAINALQVKLTKTNTLIEYNENLLKEEKIRLIDIQKELDRYGHVIEHEFR